MASTDSDGSSGGGSAVDRALAFLQEPLGLGLVAGVVIALGLGYYIF